MGAVRRPLLASKVFGQEDIFVNWNLVCVGLASRAAGGKHLSVGPREALVNRKRGGDGSRLSW